MSDKISFFSLFRDPKALQMGIYGAAGGFVGSLIGEFFDRPTKNSFIEIMIHVGVWFGIIGGFISLAILIGQNIYFKRKLFSLDTFTRGFPFGFLSGVIAGGLAQGIYSFIGPTEVLRVICWTIAGGLLGYGLSYRIPNLGRKNGVLGGSAGGITGGILFILFAVMFGDVWGRFFGIGAIGFFIGLMLIFIESLSRKAWLKVIYGPNEFRSINLGSEVVSLGSDSKACTLYVSDVPPIALKFKIDQGQIKCKDGVSGRVSIVNPGNIIKLGNVNIEICST